jgi:hypothetical protein
MKTVEMSVQTLDFEIGLPKETTFTYSNVFHCLWSYAVGLYGLKEKVIEVIGLGMLHDSRSFFLISKKPLY